MKRICIYARKSKFTGAGESVETQIELCQNHCKLQYGDDCAFTVFTDENISGKNTDRPAFLEMYRQIQSGNFDLLICYRLDRVSRSVADFSTFLDELTEHQVDFVSVRENFDTSTPMGRAMIYIASVFGQLERETTAERVRDNKFKLYRTGRWQGGPPPLGFTAKALSVPDETGAKRKMTVLQPDEEGLAFIRMLFDRFLALGSVSKLETALLRDGVRSSKGNELSASVLKAYLTNPVYATNDPVVYDYLAAQGVDLANERSAYDGKRGLIGYAKTVTVGNRHTTRNRNQRSGWIVAISHHPGIIDGARWVLVQQRIAANGAAHPRTGTSNCSLFSGLIRCSCGAPMIVKGNRRTADGKDNFYYKCQRKDKSQGTLCTQLNLHGPTFDQDVVALLQTQFTDGAIAQGIAQAFTLSEQAQTQIKKQLKQCQTKRAQNDALLFNLVKKLGESDSKELDAAIKANMRPIVQENEALAAQMEALNQRMNQEGAQLLNLELLRQAATDFCDGIATRSTREQREILAALVRSITWDGQMVRIDLFDGRTLSHRLHPKSGLLPKGGNYSSGGAIPPTQNSPFPIPSTIPQSLSIDYAAHRLREAQTLPEQLLAYRRFKNLTQADLGAALGVSRTTICRLETGQSTHIGQALRDRAQRLIAQAIRQLDPSGYHNRPP